jgi:hypothetical protein
LPPWLLLLALWLVADGVMSVYTPLSGSGLNMGESVNRILIGRSLTGQTSALPEDIMRCGKRLRAAGTPLRRRSPGVANAGSTANGADNVTTLSVAPAPTLAARTIGELPLSNNGVGHAK